MPVDREFLVTACAPPSEAMLGASVGAPILEVLPSLLRGALPAGSTVHIALQRIPRRTQTRLAYEVEAQAPLERAQRLRKEHGIAFWDALLMETVAEGERLPAAVLDAAQFHQVTQTYEEIGIDEVSTPRLQELCDGLGPREIVSCLSMVMSGGAVRQLPLLDFALPAGTPQSEVVAQQVVERLHVPGWLFRSGRSFHFYGGLVLSQNEWHAFLGRASLFSPLVDQRWIAHQLIEGCAALRISPGYERQIAPTLVCAVSPASRRTS